MMEYDNYINISIYPDPNLVFQISLKSLPDIKKDCLFVLDSNTLLIPYSTSFDSYHKIKKVYSQLIKEKRLFIPSQVVREFAKNRPKQLTTLFQQLNSKVGWTPNINSIKGSPLLETIGEYKKALNYENKIKSFSSKYSTEIKKILGQIKKWKWDDPLSILYKELFADKYIIVDIMDDVICTKKKINDDLERRTIHDIPPGFKDKKKDDHGIGDLLIWHTIIHLGASKEKNIVFVTSEEKMIGGIKSISIHFTQDMN